MAWMEGIERSMFGLKKVIKTEDLTAAEYPEIAPDYWVPIVLGNQSPQTFWNELVKSTEPTGVDEDDLNGVKPWWEFRERQDANILVPRAQPKIEGIDPDETQGERLARENDFGSDKHTENRKRLEKAKRDAERDKRKRAQEKSRRISEKMPNLMVNREVSTHHLKSHQQCLRARSHANPTLSSTSDPPKRTTWQESSRSTTTTSNSQSMCPRWSAALSSR